MCCLVNPSSVIVFSDFACWLFWLIKSLSFDFKTKKRNPFQNHMLYHISSPSLTWYRCIRRGQLISTLRSKFQTTFMSLYWSCLWQEKSQLHFAFWMMKIRWDLAFRRLFCCFRKLKLRLKLIFPPSLYNHTQNIH